MTLQLIDHRAEAAVKHSWTPFLSSEGYENAHWWSSAGAAVGDPWFVQVFEAGIDVARVQFDDPGGISPFYANVPELGDERLEIQHIEVAAGARRNKVATRVVYALAQRHPHRRMFAYSMDADAFWDFIGWEPLYDSRPGPAGRTLFIQPARWPVGDRCLSDNPSA